MKRHSFIILITLLVCLPDAMAQDHGFGVGVMIGEPTGISAKLWLSQATALDFGFGWSFGGDRIDGQNRGYDGASRTHFHMDYLWHWFNVIQSTQRFPIYTGVGGRFNTGAGYDNSAAVRVVFGIAWFPKQRPIDIVLELVPSLQVTPSTGFGIDAGLGTRYFF